MRATTAAAAGDAAGITTRLSSNESPFGPSPAALTAAAAALGTARLYPDDQSLALRTAIAAHEGVTVAGVAVAAGSTPLLLDAIRHSCPDGGEVLTFDKAFRAYAVGAANARGTHVRAPVGGPATSDRGGYHRDVRALIERITPATRVVVIDHPGNPTGAHLTGTQLGDVASHVPDSVTLIVDEAYHHFATGQRGYRTAAELGLDHPRLVTVRTFSKAHALAGMRVGYLLGPEELVRTIEERRARFNVPSASQAAAIASLADDEHVRWVIDGTIQGRQRIQCELRSLGVPFTPALGNFVTVELGTNAREVVAAYLRHGIGVRALASYGMTQQIRVTVGTPEEVESFLTASKTVLASVPSRT